MSVNPITTNPNYAPISQEEPLIVVGLNLGIPPQGAPIPGGLPSSATPPPPYTPNPEVNPQIAQVASPIIEQTPQAFPNSSIYPQLNPEASRPIIATTLTSRVLPNSSIYPQAPSETPLHTFHATWRGYPTCQQPIQNTAPTVDPVSFRKSKDLPYVFLSYSKPIFQPDELNQLNHCLSNFIAGFDPWNIDKNHQIHKELINICTRLLNNCKAYTDLDTKIKYLNEAIAQLAMNYYKAPLQAELLEIALRNYLYHGLLSQEGEAIIEFHKTWNQFPNNLRQRELALYNFSTKEDFHQCPELNVAQYLIGGISKIHSDACIDRTAVDLPLTVALGKNEDAIAKQLISLQLSETSQCSSVFELDLREGMTHKIIAKLAEQYRTEFQKTGKIDQDQFQTDCKNLEAFFTANGRFQSTFTVDLALIGQTFELPNIPNPFETVRAKINNETQQQFSQLYSEKKPQKLLALLTRPFTPSKKDKEKRIQDLGNNKIETVTWAEKEWNRITTPVIQTVSKPVEPTAPVLQPKVAPLLPTAPAITVIHPIPEPVSLVPVPAQESPAPAIPQQPLKEVTNVIVAAPEPVKPAKNGKIPVISYIDIAFKELLKSQRSDAERWAALPPLNQRDVLRHVWYQDVKGEAEDLVRRIYNNNGQAILQQLRQPKPLANPNTGLSKAFMTEGQKLIDFLYSDAVVGNYHIFIQRFNDLQKEEPFYKYVYEMAKEADVQIEPWDLQFAEYNWNKPEMLSLSIQALERCLHTRP